MFHKRNCTTISHLNASRNLARHQFTQNPVGGRAQRECAVFSYQGAALETCHQILGLFPRSGSRLGRFLGVHKLNVSAKHTMEHFSCFWSRTLWVCHGFFDADGLIAFRAFAETMTGVIHFVPWSKPTLGDQFWLFHVLSFPQAVFRRYPLRISELPHHCKLTVVILPLHSSTRSTPRGPEEMLLESTTLAIIAGVSPRLRQMIQLMPQLSFLSSVEDSCSGNKSWSATACDASPCAPLYTIAELA